MTHALKTPPGPKGLPLLGNVQLLYGDKVNGFNRARREHGPTVGLRFGPFHFITIHRPEDIRRVMLDHRDNYPKSISYKSLELLLGDGLLTSKGAAWKRRRKLMQPPFHRKRLASLAGTMTECTEDLVEQWCGQGSAELDMHEAMMSLTLRIVGRTLLSTEFKGETSDIGRAVSTAIAFANVRTESLIRPPLYVPTPRILKFKRARGLLDEKVFQVIASRRDGEERGDLLDLLLAAVDEDGEGLSDEELRDELMTLILAGHETTANALTFLFRLMALHPDVLTRVREESGEVLGDGPVTFECLPKLNYFSRVIDETLRLYPPAWMVERQALEEDELGGYRVPKNAIVAICTYSLHRDPDLWPEPDRFDPDRFLPERSEGRSRYAYLPFGAGPRFCIGNSFAKTELLIIGALLLRAFDFSVAQGAKLELDAGVTLRPKNGFWMNVSEHKAGVYARRPEPHAPSHVSP